MLPHIELSQKLWQSQDIGEGAPEAVQANLDAWLHHFNHERPHLGYRNQGRSPWDMARCFVSQEV